MSCAALLGMLVCIASAAEARSSQMLMADALGDVDAVLEWSDDGETPGVADVDEPAAATSATQPTIAAMAAPLPSVPLSSGMTMTWDPGVGVSDYMLTMGSSFEIISADPWADLFAYHGTQPSAVLPTLPDDGSTVYVRLWSKVSTRWYYNDYTYVLADLAPASVVSPASGAVLKNRSQTFSWPACESCTEYIFMLATRPEILDAEPWADLHYYEGTSTTVTTERVLPLDGKDVYVRLWSKVSGVWRSVDQHFATFDADPAQLVAPASEATITKYAKAFQWNPVPGAKRYALAIASDPKLLKKRGAADIFKARTKDTSIVATGIPLDGKPLYVRLWSKINGEWFFNEYSYSSIVSTVPPDPKDECAERGWQTLSFSVGSNSREVLWRSPATSWASGAIVLFHGGGGSGTNWCTESGSTHYFRTFAESAVKRGFAVFALDSTDDGFNDEWGHPCGKRFDALSPSDVNVDLPLVGQVLDRIATVRAAESNAKVFMVGPSNGGFMTVRAATHFDSRIAGFVSVSAGDPYGTYLYCDNAQPDPEFNPGFYLDNETDTPISEPDACAAIVHRQEKAWSGSSPVKPSYMLFHNRNDGLVNLSCMEKVRDQLKAHGYPDRGTFLMGDGTALSQESHFWQADYNAPILDFFAALAVE